MPPQLRTPPPNTPKESSESVATSTMKMGSSQPPGGVAYPACPDLGALALDHELEDESDESDDESDDEAEAGVASSDRQVTLSVSSPFISISNPIPLHSYGGGDMAMC